MHPIVLLLIAGAGGYLLWDSLDEGPPEVQALDTPSGNKIVVPTSTKTPQESVSDVPIPDGQGPQAIHKPHAHRWHKPAILDPNTPTVITPTGAANLSVQTTADVQRALSTIGMANLAPTGILDPKTKSAIASLQRQLGMPVTGIPDLSTVKNIQAALGNLGKSVTAIGNHPAVQQATQDSANALASSASQLSVTSVSALQKALNAIGTRPSLKPDGIVGPKTTAALKAFQISQGLVSDGVLGPKTLTALQASVDPKTMNALASAPSVFTGEFGGGKRRHKKHAA